MCAEGWFFFSIDSEFLAVFQAVLLIFNAGSLDLSNSLPSVGPSHALLPLGWLQYSDCGELVFLGFCIAATILVTTVFAVIILVRNRRPLVVVSHLAIK